MVRWVGYERQRAGEDLIWSGDFQFGDWLDVLPGSRGNFGATDTDLIATAYFAHSVDLLGRAALALGKSADAARYQRLFADICAAFQRKFVDPTGRVGSGTQTAQSLALQFDLLSLEQRKRAASYLVKNVREVGHLTTGLAGTPRLLFALSDHGYVEDAYRLLLRETYPSWLYPITRGATTIWERWDGVKPDGSLQNPAMNSFNQYVYGSVGDWMYRVVAGINTDPSAPGYKRVLVKPKLGDTLRFANSHYVTPYGMLRVSWRINDGILSLDVTVPPNSTALVSLPKARLSAVRESALPIVSSREMISRQSGEDVDVDIGSGEYHFLYPIVRVRKLSFVADCFGSAS
jgi:alpha-L-rhamnosidase